MLPYLTQDVSCTQVRNSSIVKEAQWSFSDHSSEILRGMGQLLSNPTSNWLDPPVTHGTLSPSEIAEALPPCSQWSILSEHMTYSTAGSSSLTVTPLGDRSP